MHQLPAFANMTMSVRRELCAVMVFAVVERAGTIVLNDGEEVRKYFYQLTMSLCEARSMQQRTKTLSSLKTMGNNKFALLGIMIHSLCQSLFQIHYFIFYDLQYLGDTDRNILRF